jgi:predicted metal-binding membrane protein
VSTVDARVLDAARRQLGLVALLVALAAFAWWSTVRSMGGMGASPGTDLGTLGWFVGVWIVMMAAMMLPAVSPTVALYTRMTRQRGLARPVAFTSGYLVVWGAVGVAAYGVFALGKRVLGPDLAWHSGGRWLAGGILAGAALYELTPLKHVCLGKCRSPFGFLMGAWRDGVRGAADMGAKHGAWCFGCCWALMVGLFALGVMSLVWMAAVAALITVEKVLPWRRIAVWSTTALLLALAIGVFAAPDAIPGFVIPGGGATMSGM